MRPRSRLVVLALAVAPAIACGGGREPLRVFAAASLRDVLVEIAPMWERGGGAPLEPVFGASNWLAEQISAGARGDLFLSADEAQMDSLERAGLLLAGTRVALLSNRLAVVQPEPLPAGVPRIRAEEDLLDPAVRRIALANTEGVPAGRYARRWLEARGLWSSLAPRVAPAIDARAALALVESGAAEAGIVYATDAARSRRARTSLLVTGPDAPSIVYPLAVLRSTDRERDARAFAAFLAGPQAAEAFEQHGFTLLAGG
jgi:molybdate transport system substrate-binding protein